VTELDVPLEGILRVEVGLTRQKHAGEFLLGGGRSSSTSDDHQVFRTEKSTHKIKGERNQKKHHERFIAKTGILKLCSRKLIIVTEKVSHGLILYF
jgi:hypothetical protein